MFLFCGYLSCRTTLSLSVGTETFKVIDNMEWYGIKMPGGFDATLFTIIYLRLFDEAQIQFWLFLGIKCKYKRSKRQIMLVFISPDVLLHNWSHIVIVKRINVNNALNDTNCNLLCYLSLWQYEIYTEHVRYFMTFCQILWNLIIPSKWYMTWLKIVSILIFQIADIWMLVGI